MDEKNEKSCSFAFSELDLNTGDFNDILGRNTLNVGQNEVAG